MVSTPAVIHASISFVDGMDNQAPGLNFSVGAIIGLSELDVDNLELLSGASSALYGPGGMNGTLLMTSKTLQIPGRVIPGERGHHAYRWTSARCFPLS